MESLQTWFKPERVLPSGEEWASHKLFSVDWLPYMMISELVISIMMKRQVYNLRQLINNLAAPAFFHLVARLGMRALLVVPYTYIYNNYRLVEWNSSYAWWMHLLALVFCDLCTYWVHRAMHEWNLGWAGHIIHHSSMDYNMSVGVRGGAFDIAHFGFATYLPLALVCPPHIYLAHRTSNFVYSVFVHTELVPKLWWPIELIMNTPSHHRVHHARNYGRKNFGDVLIIWDRMFGTFQEEREDRKPLYGLNNQPVVQGTYNPLWHQVHHLLATVKLACSGTMPATKALFTRVTGPGMVHPSTTAAIDENAAVDTSASKHVKSCKHRGHANVEVAVDASTNGAFDPSYPWEKRAFTAMDFYAAFQCFAIVHPALNMLKNASPLLSIPHIIGGAAFAAWSATTVAWVCGSTALAMKHELFRLAVQGASTVYFLHNCPAGTTPLAIQAAQGIIVLSAMSFLFVIFQLPKSIGAGRATRKVA